MVAKTEFADKIKIAALVFTLFLLFVSAQASAAASDTAADKDRFQTDLIDIQAKEAGVKYPEAVTPKKAGEIIKVTHDFTFNSKERTIELSIDKNEYLAAEKTDKNIRAKTSDIKKEDWAAGYYLTLATDSISSTIYHQITAELQKIKNEENLDSDAYADLITAFVQSIPYETAGLAPKYPVETIYEMKGDCDDKSILLAALLAIEGYDTILMYFEDENHVAAGILGTTGSQKDDDYIFIETTKTGLIGIVPKEVNNRPFNSKNPLIIPFSNSGEAYTSYDENILIQNYLSDISDNIAGKNYESAEELRELHLKYNTVVKNITNRDYLYNWITA